MILKKDNVERVAETPGQIEKLKAYGYSVLNGGKTVKDESSVELTGMNMTELKELAKEKGLEGYSSLTKEQLLEVLKDVVK